MRPAAGVWCSACLARGHKCQAQMYEENAETGREDVPLCLYCLDGEFCSVDRVGPPQAPEMYEPERGMPEAVAPAAPVRWNGRATKEPRVFQRIVDAEVYVAPAVKEAILAYPDGTAYTQIAREQGVSEHIAKAIRKNAGFQGKPPRRAGKPQREPETKIINGEPVVMDAGVVMGPEVLSPERKTEMPRSGGSSHSTMPISEEVKARIREEGPEKTHREVAKQYRVGESTVRRIRASGPPAARMARLRHAIARKVTEAQAEEQPAALVKAEQRKIVIDATQPAAVEKLIEASPVNGVAEDVVITLRLTAHEARQQLGQLSGAEMAIALQAVHEARMRG